MSAVKNYFLTLCAVSLLVSILQTVFSLGRREGVVKLSCGLLLAATVLSPLRKLDTGDLTRKLSDLEFPQTEAAAVFSYDDTTLLTEIIKEKTEAYIWDKAHELGFVPEDVSAEIAAEEAYPCGITIRGQYTQDQRMELTRWIENNLGVEQKAQTWTWE